MSNTMNTTDTTPTTLPDKPSALIRVALADLRKVERDKRYKVDMANWHEPGVDVCYVCLAGAVMAKSIRIDPKASCTPKGTEHSSKLYALNRLREGRVGWAFHNLGIRDDGNKFDRYITVYSFDPEAFHADMNKLADDLEAAGY